MRPIEVPPALVPRLERLVEKTAERNGETQDAVRRGVEQAVLARGIQELELEAADSDARVEPAAAAEAG